MNSYDLETIVNVLFWVFYIVVVSAGVLYGQYRAKRRKLRMSGGSVLLAYYTDNTQLHPIAHGEVGDMHYTAFASLNKGVSFYQIELPFSANVHLLSIPNRDSVARLNPTGRNSIMEPLVLEGDHPDTFTMYCQKGQQQQARYVMDPKAMVFTMDFCASHNWEIIDNLLYFVQAGGRAENDPTHMFDDIERFVDEVRPAIAKPLTDAQRNVAAPYGHDRREGLLCPVCSKELINHDTYYVCSDGHGLLLKGGALMDLRRGELQLKKHNHDTASLTREGDEITCPACGASMHKVPYNGDANTVIDSCSACPYRWIDGGDIRGVQVDLRAKPPEENFSHNRA